MIDIPLHKLTGFNLEELPLQGHIRTLIDFINGQNGFKLSFLFLFHGQRNYDALNFIKDDKFYSFFIHNLSCNVYKIVKASTKSNIFNRKPSVEVA